MHKFVILVMRAFTKHYNIKANMPDRVKNLKPPFLVLSNHVGFWDPFVIGYVLPGYTHFVSSDAAFRNPIFRFFLTRLGTIPKKKNMRDSQVIRDIVSVIRQGESVGLFPEAVRTWSGATFPLDPSIGKLIKMLKVPVVICRLKGMNLFNPRWSPHLRKTKVEIDYNLLFTQEMISTLDSNEIHKLLNSRIDFDEVVWQSNQLNEIYSEKRAEYISHALFVCPECEAIDSFIAHKNDFECSNCGEKLFVNKYGFFENGSVEKPKFENIRDWYNWQEKYLLQHIKKSFLAAGSDAILVDENSLVYQSGDDNSNKFLGRADLKLFYNRIEIDFKSKKEKLILDFDKLKTCNPQVSEILEIYYDNTAYRIKGGRKGVSALKWEIAMNAIWRLQGQTTKLSPYINSSFLTTN